MDAEPQLAPDAPSGLGKAMTGAGKKVARRANDFYPTPPEATRALMIAEMPYIARHNDRRMWEPCGRGGAIARVAQDEFGLEVIATDIVPDPGNDVDALDLLAARQLLAPIVITNFPFALARPMVRHMLAVLNAPYLAMLHKTTWPNCEKGARLFADYPHNRRWDMTWRLDFVNGGNPAMTTTWFIWDRASPALEHGLIDRNGPVLPRHDLFS